MRIGTVRAGETAVFGDFRGYHRFHMEETQEPYGSFEVFHADDYPPSQPGDEALKDGWYWWACSAGCLPHSDPIGPFATSRQALQDADIWNPEFDDDYDNGEME